MQVQMPTWEQALITLAYEARQSMARSPIHHAEPAQLTRAYGYCEELTAAHSKSFYLASRLLPPEKRRAVRALYSSIESWSCRNSSTTPPSAETRKRMSPPRG